MVCWFDGTERKMSLVNSHSLCLSQWMCVREKKFTWWKRRRMRIAPIEQVAEKWTNEQTKNRPTSCPLKRWQATDWLESLWSKQENRRRPRPAPALSSIEAIADTLSLLKGRKRDRCVRKRERSALCRLQCPLLLMVTTSTLLKWWIVKRDEQCPSKTTGDHCWRMVEAAAAAAAAKGDGADVRVQKILLRCQR